MPLIFVSHFRNIFCYTVLNLDNFIKKKVTNIIHFKIDRRTSIFVSNILESLNYRFPETQFCINILVHQNVFSRLFFRWFSQHSIKKVTHKRFTFASKYRRRNLP